MTDNRINHPMKIIRTLAFLGANCLTAASAQEGEECTDSLTPFVTGSGVIKGCPFIANDLQRCNAVGVSSHCPETCDACDLYACEDSSLQFKFRRDEYYCIVLEQLDEDRKARACEIELISSTCRASCGYCDTGSWVQIGSDIDGEAAGDGSGESVSLSEDGLTVAIGAPFNDADIPDYDKGHVRVYTYSESESEWSQLGDDIDGEGFGNYSGNSVSLSSDGRTVAVGADSNDDGGFYSGHVRVYRYSESESKWNQIGDDIDGEDDYDFSGISVSLSRDGNTVAIGAYLNDGEDANASGHVRVYTLINSSVWIQVGDDIDGEAAGDLSGRSVALSGNGQIVAIGAPKNGGNGYYSGHVRVFVYNPIEVKWIPVGDDINGEAAGDESGESVSLSQEGNVVAIGAKKNDGTADLSGHVRVYKYDESEFVWNQVGDDIDGEAEVDFSGNSVSLSQNGEVVAIGASDNNGDDLYNGHVRVYKYDMMESTWIQVGEDINGEDELDRLGQSVSLSGDGSILAVGAVGNDGNGDCSGHVRVFKYM